MQIMSSIERKAYREGELRGEQRGEQRGELQGEQREGVKILVNLLTLKFKSIPLEYLTIIENANTIDLEKWAGNCLTARTIEEVFG